MNRSNVTELCCVFSAINPQLHWLSHDQNLWQMVSKTNLKAQELALLVMQFNSLIYIQGSFLIIAWQYLLKEHFQVLQPSKERERKEIQVKFSFLQ